MCDKTNSSSVQTKLYGKPFAGLFGYSLFAGGYAGGQAEYVRCPFGDANLLKIPDSVPDEKALYLSDILPTSYHSVICADVKEGKSVAIWGAGPIGLLAAKWSKLAKARRVIVIDNVPERLALARDTIGAEVMMLPLSGIPKASFTASSEQSAWRRIPLKSSTKLYEQFASLVPSRLSLITPLLPTNS
jgi:threonine dehydrogenase-like Zn-dependent dehydrogenase